jgi:hypothetical protein
MEDEINYNQSASLSDHIENKNKNRCNDYKRFNEMYKRCVRVLSLYSNYKAILNKDYSKFKIEFEATLEIIWKSLDGATSSMIEEMYIAHQELDDIDFVKLVYNTKKSKKI